MSDNNNKLKIRIKFKKFGNVKFVGHLDTLRYFQKVMRRSDIDIAYSEGFSPHQIMSFAAPLGVGTTSDGEYMDIEVYTTKSTKASVESLNSAMVEGFEILDYRLLPSNAKNAMSVVTCADYTLTYREGYEPPLGFDELTAKAKEFYNDAKEILVVKKTKKNEVTLNLKELVYDFEIRKAENGIPCFYMKVSTGSTDNIKPEMVAETFYKFIGVELPEFALSKHRHDVYSGTKEEGFVSLNDFGEIIE